MEIEAYSRQPLSPIERRQKKGESKESMAWIEEFISLLYFYILLVFRFGCNNVGPLLSAFFLLLFILTARCMINRIVWQRIKSNTSKPNKKDKKITET